MTDHTYTVAALQDARGRLMDTKRQIKSEEERKAKAAAQIVIAERIRDAEIAFAKELARANAEGVPQSVLRRDVLRTNTWDVWTYWRDLAEIEPERVIIRNAKAEREALNAGSRWDLVEGLFYLQKDKTGQKIEPPIIYRIDSIRKTRDGKMWIADPVEDDPRDLENMRAVSNEIEAAVARGEIEP